VAPAPLEEGALPGAFEGEQFGDEGLDRKVEEEKEPAPDVDKSGFFGDKLAVPYHEADRDVTQATSKFGDKGALAQKKQQLAPRVLEMRLTALGKRVKQMHDQWMADRGATNSRAMEREASKLAGKLDPLMFDIEKKATISLHVRDLRSQQTLYDHKGEELRNPASNQKMLTASASLDLLGPEYRFKTEVYSKGDTLYLVGGGDPTLDPTRIIIMAKELAAAANMDAIKHFVIDENNFTKDRFIPGLELDNIGLYYMAPTGPLSFNGNIVRITVKATAPGQPALVTAEPNNGHIAIDSSIVTMGDADGAGISIRTQADGNRTVVVAQGKVAAGSKAVTEKRRISDPGMFTGEAFVQALAEATSGLRYPVARGEHPPNAILVKRWESKPLFEIVQDAMAVSDNYKVEMVLRTLARELTGEPGDYDVGTTILEGYWNVIGVNPEALVAENGSGLSRAGRFTAAGLVDLISAAHMTQFPNSGLIAVLPVAGRPGTLHHRHKEARGRLKAKTGTLNGVSALSGILTDLDGDPVLGLSIMLNPGEDSQMSVGERHAAEEKIVGVLLKYIAGHKSPRAGARRRRR
jgi:D-alanyl-D-alanine carboxypeptidase/D-alanyl-D-alanine-endopeptidase (penicillin-binding protein 4)